ncbi:MAG: acetyl-CoA C-acetyltransferase [Bacteroidetes bacterium]|jgi:acetyl-CoA C-acetyltransferase|nr:acetyl-CoA C-acetyltransferase [Bacteroidota bacterium]MBL0287183.1 acetyl-CoA C-acetyltransferase [Bacteroidota bacterium]
MSEAYIYDCVRTPRGKGKKNGTLHEVSPTDLLAQMLIALKERNNLDTSLVEDVIIGCVTPVGDQGGNIAKTAAMMANYANEVPGFQLNRFCASGLEAVNLAAMKVRSGWQDLVIAGGVESMSRVPMGMDGGAWVLDMKVNAHTDFVPQGISADLIATLEGFTREDCDKYALRSQQLAGIAKAEGRFNKSIVPIKDINGLDILTEDEYNRTDTTLEGLSSLNPAFTMMGEMGFDAVALQKYTQLEKINHVHTPGNSSGIVDGAALVLIGSKAIGEKLGLKPRAVIKSVAVISTEPTIMLTGPGPASLLALKKAGMNIGDIDLVEMNEAFSSAVLRLQRDINVPFEKLNVNGGAIALGHPLGATGAMILGTLVDELERTNKSTGLATLCVGGGMGIATVVELV